ncbi:hypothetical protein [Methylobacterium sp. ID0610]|uniref:hypothetical protein n=1 Tax=Methylobacterium carpenticola TaxID=3344827 RepID=UPI0036862330
MTDGADDLRPSGLHAGCADVDWPSACSSLKSAGIQVATIQASHTAYGDSGGPHDTDVRPVAGRFGDAFASCASSASLNMRASDGPAIVTAAQRRRQQIAATNLRLTN